MLTKHNPPTIMAPIAQYTHGVEAASDMRWLFVSGQVGITRDGTLAEGSEAQMETAWRNVLAVVESAGMGAADIVKINIYVTRLESLPLVREARSRVLGDAAPASTLVVISSLVDPAFEVEIEAVAAAAP